MSQRFTLATGTRLIGAVSISAAHATSTNKPSTRKHFAFAANYAAYATHAKRGSWSTIG